MLLRRRAVAGVVAVLLVALLRPWGTANAAFTGGSANPGNRLAAGSLSAPTGLTLTPACASGVPSVGASWTAGSGGSTPTGYKLQRQLSGTTQNTVAAAGTSATDTGMANGQTYTYQVFSYLSGWTSAAASNTVAVNCATNLLANPGFETGGTSAPWLTDSTGSAVATVSTPVHAGAGAVRVPISSQLYTTVSVAAGTTYTFSAWAYTAPGTGSVSALLRVISGSSLYGSTVLGSVQGSGTAGSWSQYTVTFSTGAATSVTLSIGTGTASYDVYTDDVSLA
ncbi:carbohydrate binding domain-containing protein [Dactylosporangium sp. CS-033363]|uniref:carbohydrate binding domain-containing protein n=1 Tax=Dactylosporangium sp. CS-033363 TaxID=3239935 RepID=UPI003D93D32D